MAQLESFFLGIIASLGALVIELVVFIGFSFFTNSTSDVTFSQLFTIPQLLVVSVFIEEIFKYIVIAKRVEMMSLGRSYLINSFFVGLGFFAIELGMISMTGTLPATNLLIEIAIIHIGTAGLIGYMIAVGNPRKVGTFLSAVILTAIFHVSYNLLALDRTVLTNYAIFAVLAMLIFFNVINLARINRKLAHTLS